MNTHTTPDIEGIVDALRPIIKDHAGEMPVGVYIHRTAVIEALKSQAEQYERERGILQGSLYGYELRLMAPKEARSDIINENTLEQYIKKSQKYGVDISELNSK